jgi:putative endonuclease
LAKHQQLGKAGEALAATWLQQKGFTLLHQNWRHGHCEVDLIAHLAGVLHFIEVKTRSNSLFGQPEESVHTRKMLSLLKASEAFQHAYPEWKRVQFDVLSITISAGTAPVYFFIEDVYL